MNVPSTMAALTGQKVRWRLAELATEAAMVVFAVLVALGVEQWREERQLRAFADRARAAVDLEIQQNLDEFRRTGTGLTDGRERTGTALRALLQVQRGEMVSGSVELDLGLDLPDISTAAWRVAQASQAAPYFDYDWVIERARLYDDIERYLDVTDEVMRDLSALAGSMVAQDVDTSVAALQPLFGRLEILGQVHAHLQEGMEEYLEGAVTPADLSPAR